MKKTIFDKLICSAERIDNNNVVKGYYLRTPLTSENFSKNFGGNHFGSDGKIRDCISDENGCVYEIKPNTLKFYKKPKWYIWKIWFIAYRRDTPNVKYVGYVIDPDGDGWSWKRWFWNIYTRYVSN